jgi:hypothetical protein
MELLTDRRDLRDPRQLGDALIAAHMPGTSMSNTYDEYEPAFLAQEDVDSDMDTVAWTVATYIADLHRDAAQGDETSARLLKEKYAIDVSGLLRMGNERDDETLTDASCEEDVETLQPAVDRARQRIEDLESLSVYRHTHYCMGCAAFTLPQPVEAQEGVFVSGCSVCKTPYRYLVNGQEEHTP